MELRESIEEINKKLVDEFGVELSLGNSPKFRVVFSEDQFEKRITQFTDEGFALLQPEIRLLPKYRQHIRAKYILERLIPVIGETDLVAKVSYEPLWTFQDRKGNYLPPFFEGCKFVIESMYQAMGHQECFAKYKDKNLSPEERERELQKVQEQLFGNETDVGDALAYGSGIVVPGNDKLH